MCCFVGRFGHDFWADMSSWADVSSWPWADLDMRADVYCTQVRTEDPKLRPSLWKFLATPLLDLSLSVSHNASSLCIPQVPSENTVSPTVYIYKDGQQLITFVIN